MKLRELVGAGDRIGLAVLPFAVIGLALNLVFPEVFHVGGPTEWLRILSIGVLAVGVVVWAWSVVLIVTRVPRGELITHRSVRGRAAPALHERGAPRAPVARLPPQQLARRRPRDRAVRGRPPV